MHSTKEGYFLTRNVVRIEVKRNKLLKFIKTHKLLISMTVVFGSLVIIEGILINQFVKLLSFI